MAAHDHFLNKQMFVYFSTPVKPRDEVAKMLPKHLDYQVELEKKGIMFGAGPFWSDDEQLWEGEGMVIIRAASLDEARKIAESDPMHQSGARSFRVRPWLLNEGSVTLKVRYSDGSREIS